MDGKYLGDTPQEGLVLQAGTRRVRLVNPRRKLEASFGVRIKRGKTTSKVVRLR